MLAISSSKIFQHCSILMKNGNIMPSHNIFIKKYSTTSKLIQNSKFYTYFKELKFDGKSSFSYQYKIHIKKLKYSVHKHSILVVKHCSKQIEFIFAHRLRRCQQIMLLYSKWWDDLRLKLLLETFRRHYPFRNKVLFSSGFVSSVSCLNVNNNNFNIDTSLIQDSEFSKYSDEINRVYKLKGIAPKNVEKENNNNNSLKQTNFTRTTNNNSRYSTNKICKCSRCRHGTSIEGWVEIYSKDSLTFWKKEHLDHKGKGLFCYKVYGYFTDITAEDFLQVQINVDFRKEWDQTAIELKILDQDPKTQTDIVYWELRFPRFFTNRDYVFLRRCKVDEEKKVMTIINQSTSHPNCPPKSGKHRVHEFWSYMVIKPTTEFDKPGLEFVITYFDNPGIRMPAYISSWLTFTEMPDFITRQRNAALLWSKRKQNNISTFPSPSKDDSSPNENSNSSNPTTPPPSVGPPTKHNSPTPPSSPTYYQMLKNSICYMFYSS